MKLNTNNERADTGDSEEILKYDQYSISSYGADYTIDGLVKRLENGSIFIPSFQRSYVWDLKTASRFIESLILGLPVPGVFLSKEKDTEKLLVIDGQQRLKSIQFFYKGIFANDKKFKLEGVQTRLSGKSYEDLLPEDRRRLDDCVLHATIIKQDRPTDDSSIYLIFERLNSGGVALKPQEIRSCIFHGSFNDLIVQLNQNEDWRALYGKQKDKQKRDEELILRFFALYNYFDKYDKPMKGFLNKYMRLNQNLSIDKSKMFQTIFENTVRRIRENIGENAFKVKSKSSSKVNAALIDALMIAISNKTTSDTNLKHSYRNLLLDNEFISSISSHTSDNDKLAKRIDLAKKALA